MTTISSNNNALTLINVFTVQSENQQRLIDLLVHATETTMKKQPGYISANIHRSLDGTKVVNYAQWQNREAFEAIFKNQEITAHMKQAEQLALHFEPYLYEVVFTDELS